MIKVRLICPIFSTSETGRDYNLRRDVTLPAVPRQGDQVTVIPRPDGYTMGV